MFSLFSFFSGGNNDGRRSREDESPKPHTLCSAGQIRAILEREILRSDRRNEPVSAVLFDQFNRSDSRSGNLLEFAQLALKQSRVTDEIGMLEARRACAVLPETSAEGATIFARRVHDLAKVRNIAVQFRIHTYPMDGYFHDIEDEVSDKRDSLQHISIPTGSNMAGAVLPLQALVQRRTPIWKRAMDLLGATFGLIVFCPIMAVAASLIRLTSKGPIIFCQKRAGLFGIPFTIYKFRTMAPDAERRKKELRQFSEQDGPAFKMAKDPRVTMIGRFLRATSFDELPQFWNVLVGNMSLVGPRPLPMEEAAGCAAWHRHRLSVSPGLTCIWQVRGRSRVKFDDWMRMDMEYIRHMSPFRDLAILILTIPAVIWRKGAH